VQVLRQRMCQPLPGEAGIQRAFYSAEMAGTVQDFVQLAVISLRVLKV